MVMALVMGMGVLMRLHARLTNVVASFPLVGSTLSGLALGTF